jgi:hypothetical protein
MEPLGPEVRRELQRFGPAAGMADLVAAWPVSVGDGIARNAWPARFTRDGTLVVHTVDTVWAFELSQQADEIASRLGELVPKGIKFVPGPLPEPPAEATAPPPQAPPSATLEQARQAAEWAASVEDPDLRAAVARAARASLARAAAGAPSDRRF